MDYESLRQELALKAPLWRKVSSTESHQDTSTTVVYRMDSVTEWNRQKKRMPAHPPRLTRQRSLYAEDYLLPVELLLMAGLVWFSCSELWQHCPGLASWVCVSGCFPLASIPLFSSSELFKWQNMRRARMVRCFFSGQQRGLWHLNRDERLWQVTEMAIKSKSEYSTAV